MLHDDNRISFPVGSIPSRFNCVLILRRSDIQRPVQIPIGPLVAFSIALLTLNNEQRKVAMTCLLCRSTNALKDSRSCRHQYPYNSVIRYIRRLVDWLQYNLLSRFPVSFNFRSRSLSNSKKCTTPSDTSNTAARFLPSVSPGAERHLVG